MPKVLPGSTKVVTLAGAPVAVELVDVKTGLAAEAGREAT